MGGPVSEQAPPRRGRFPVQLKGLSPSPAPARAASATLMPQRHLAEAARDAQRQVAPSGLGLDGAVMRERMVSRLRADGVRCEPVLQAMRLVPRHAFVASALATQAYEDTSLPIGLGQTISKPSVVARMLEWLFLGQQARSAGHLGRVLEVGTGCGYQTALLAQLSRQVVSIERLKGLHDQAASQLRSLGLPNCRLVYGDGMRGHPPNAPYDSIIAAAGGEDLPSAWLEQLAVGGRLIAPAKAPDGRGHVLVVVDRHPDGLRRQVGEAVQFVPLKSGVE